MAEGPGCAGVREGENIDLSLVVYSDAFRSIKHAEVEKPRGRGGNEIETERRREGEVEKRVRRNQKKERRQWMRKQRTT